MKLSSLRSTGSLRSKMARSIESTGTPFSADPASVLDIADV
jgi:hypothetical protein